MLLLDNIGVETAGQSWEGSGDCVETHLGRFHWQVDLLMGTTWAGEVLLAEFSLAPHIVVMCYQGSVVDRDDPRAQRGPALLA